MSRVYPFMPKREKPQPPKRCSPGDIWELGAHRLMVGDCRDRDHVGRLFAGETAQLTFTSPPYATTRRKYDPSTGFTPISPEGYIDWWQAVQACVAPHLSVEGSFFVNIRNAVIDGYRSLYVYELPIAMKRWGWGLLDDHIWCRPGNPGAWKNRLKNGYEFVFQFTRTTEIKFHPKRMARPSKRCIDRRGKRRGRGTGTDYGAPEEREQGMALPNNVVSTQVSSESWHEAAFPVDLPNHFLSIYSDPGDMVYDPFGGSGTTLIAAERLGRRCLTMELSPAYADGCLMRYEQETGKTVRKVDPDPPVAEEVRFAA